MLSSMTQDRIGHFLLPFLKYVSHIMSLNYQTEQGMVTLTMGYTLALRSNKDQDVLVHKIGLDHLTRTPNSLGMLNLLDFMR